MIFFCDEVVCEGFRARIFRALRDFFCDEVVCKGFRVMI